MADIWALALHGGAGPLDGSDYDASEAHMRSLLEAGKGRLETGASALDIVEEMVAGLEACGLHVAGRGASPNMDNIWELDAAIMDGSTRKAGAVAALVGYKSPVAAARLVMERTPNVLLVGAGAEAFAAQQGLEAVGDPLLYYKPAPSKTSQSALTPQRGTVGAVALDKDGRLAAATSTGGVTGKTPGRVGDTPIIGAGTWADERVAVSCTGLGEYFMRSGVAADVSARIRYGGQFLSEAASGAIRDMGKLGGEGGLIAINASGEVEMVFDTSGMKRGCATSAGRFEVATFRDEASA